MNNLFEDFVREYLKESLTGYNVTKHHTHLDKNKELELKPDIVISKRRSNIMIIDTKYKILDERRPQEDVSQILSYCLAEKAPIGLLIYPKFEEEIEKEYEIKNTEFYNPFCNYFSCLIC
jgi:5-methylcytosine-specific restriction enzyme subunit McrC